MENGDRVCHTGREHIPVRRNTKCKGPGVGTGSALPETRKLGDMTVSKDNSLT